MNDYRITYTTEAGDSFDSIITEHAVPEVILDVLLSILEAPLEGGGEVALRAQLLDHLPDGRQRVPEKLRQEIAERQRARDEAQEFIKKLEAMVLSPDDLEDLRQLASDRATEADELAGKAAAEIVKPCRWPHPPTQPRRSAS